MAYVGLRKPYVGQRTVSELGVVAFAAPEQMAKAVSLEITPNYSEGTLYADDGQAEYDKEFKDADITLGTDTIPVSMQGIMFGHTVSESDSTVTHNSGDQAPYVGMGIVEVQKVNDVKTFVAAFLPRVKFSEPSESFETKGDSITYKTPSISGKAFADDEGIWKKTCQCTTEEAAIAWIKTQFGVSA